MRTAGLLLMDTPMPDGRLIVRPQDFYEATVTISAGQMFAPFSATANTFAQVSGMLLRYGMSDDAQQNFGMGAPGSAGFQGAQAQLVSSGQPFTTPYGQSGRPPQPSSSFGVPTTSRPKGLKPVALSVAYQVAGTLTSLEAKLFKTSFSNGVNPTATTIFDSSAFSTTTGMNVVSFPLASGNQNFLVDPFDTLVLELAIVLAAASQINIYAAYIDFQFNYN